MEEKQKKTVRSISWTNPDKSGATLSYSTDKVRTKPRRAQKSGVNGDVVSENKKRGVKLFSKKGGESDEKMPRKRASRIIAEETLQTSREKKTDRRKTAKNPPVVKIHFLGGVEEIGKNCTAIECLGDIIVVDAGMSFPSEEMPGIDFVIPDTSFLKNNIEKVRGIILTHGHEDHVGGLPYMIGDVPVPVYGTKLTLMILENKLVEKKIDADMHTVKAGSVIDLGCFRIEFIHVNHSIEGSTALAITCPAGVIFHTGDFKVDYTPVDGKTTDLTRIAEIGREGVLLLLAESTNVEKAGYTMSEKTVGKTLDTVFADNPTKRIIVATFASNVHRVQQIIDLAEKYKRKVALSGRSMINIAQAAMEIGALDVKEDTLVDIEKIDKIADKDLCIISTGTQGEPMSALTRMAADNFNKVHIDENDVVIVSASPIPGNEKMVYRVINNLYKLGADVIYSKLSDVHVSGHACQEELKLIHNLVNPKYFIPVHGEYRHLKMHKDLAVSMGMSERNCLIPEIGDTIDVSEKVMKKAGKVQAGAILVDGLGFNEVDSVLLRDRKHLAEDGLMIVVANINTESGEIIGDIEVIPKGVGISGEQDKFVADCKQTVIDLLTHFDLKTFSGRIDAKDAIRSRLKNYVDKKVKNRPMVLPIFMEV